MTDKDLKYIKENYMITKVYVIPIDNVDNFLTTKHYRVLNVLGSSLIPDMFVLELPNDDDSYQFVDDFVLDHAQIRKDKLESL